MCDNCELEYSINIKAQPLNNQIYRIYFIDMDDKLLPYLQFKFEYKYFNQPLWHDIRPFDYRSCRISQPNGDIFTYIRIPNKLYNYTLHIRLSLIIFANAFGFVSNQWMKYSDILTIKVLSSLYYTPSFTIPSLVKFHNENIIDICSNTYHSKHIPYSILLQLLADDVIDFCIMDRNYADFEILFRSNIFSNDSNNTYFNIYCSLIDCGIYFASEYFEEYEDDYNGEIAINGQGRCFAFNVMCMLFGDIIIKNDYNLKLNCFNDCGANLYTKNINTVNKYRINKYLGQEWIFGCDMCQSLVNEFDFMFHCDNNDQLKHNFCILCVFEITQKYQYFKHLLKPLLLNNKLLNNVCIDVLISFVVGKVIKFEYDECKQDL
eukprot:136950_1